MTAWVASSSTIPGLTCSIMGRRAPADLPSNRPPRSRRVLVIEPRPALAQALSEGLDAAGYEVCSAADGIAALYGLGDHRHDAVVLDLDVPAVSGHRLMQLLKQEPPPVPVLVVTSRSFDEVVDTLRFGGDDLLELPDSPGTAANEGQSELAEQVVTRVRRLLATSATPTKPFRWRESPAALDERSRFS